PPAVRGGIGMMNRRREGEPFDCAGISWSMSVDSREEACFMASPTPADVLSGRCQRSDRLAPAMADPLFAQESVGDGCRMRQSQRSFRQREIEEAVAPLIHRGPNDLNVSGRCVVQRQRHLVECSVTIGPWADDDLVYPPGVPTVPMEYVLRLDRLRP